MPCIRPSRLLKNTRIGLFSWPSCVSRPPPTTVRTGTRCPDAGASDTRGRRSGTPRLQIPQPDQGIGGGGEGELPIHQGDAAMPELAQAADGLHPAEDLFHEFSFPLTHVIARMPRGPTVDRTPADLLRHVGRDVLDAHVGNEARHIVALVRPDRAARGGAGLQQQHRRVAFGGPRRVGRADVGDTPLSIVQQHVAEIRQLGFLAFALPMAGERIDAFSFWNGDRPFLFLASDKDAACRSRFDVAHELGHLVLHRWVGQDKLEDPKVLKEVIEPEANRFAGAFLAPAQSFPAEVYTTRLDAFVALKRRWRLAVQAMVYRCKDLGVFDEYQVTNLYKQISARRWRTREPLDDTDEIPLEQPRMLNRAANLVFEGGARKTEDLCLALGISRQDIEQLCNLAPGTLADRPPKEFVPTLK